jgi:peptide/nickel transport system substrate-binding protein
MKTSKWLNVMWLLVLVAMVVSACAPAATPTASQPTQAPAPTQPPAPTQAPAATKPPAPTQAPAATQPPAATKAPVAATLEVTAQGKKILHVAYSAEIDVLNAFTSQNLTDPEVAMIEGLIMSNDKNQYIPVLAKEIPTYENGGAVKRPDGKVDMTWHLQEGVKWQDGVEFTSKDVCFTWNYIVGEPQVYNQDQYLNIESCKEVDKYTVLFTWKNSYAPYNTLFEALLPEHLLGKMTPTEITNNEAYNRSPLGTGPFKFAEWKSGEYIRVVKNPDYWRGPQYPMLDEIVFNFIPDNNTRLNAMKSKEDDLGIGFQANQVKDLKAIDGYSVSLVNSNAFTQFGTSIKSEKGKLLFSDPNVRKAMYYAIDRESIAKDLMEGTVTVATTQIAPFSPYYNPNTTVYNFDPEKSKQMLDAAGWKVGSDGIRVKNGQRFSFTLLNRAGRNDRIAIAQVIQAQLKDVGIEVLMDTKESAAWTGQWRTGNWEAIVGGWFMTADPSVTNLYSCKGANNMTGYCNPKADDAMNAADQALDFKDRKPLMDQVQALLADGAPDLPIYFNVLPISYSNKLQNFKGSGTNLGSFWNSYEWDLTQ